MKITTGFGYYVDSKGRKLHKYELPKGEHPDPIGYTFVEVNSQEDLDKIVLDKNDEQLQNDTKMAMKNYHRNAALAKLKALGFLPEQIDALFN